MDHKYQKIMNYGLILAIMIIMALNSFQIYAIKNSTSEGTSEIAVTPASTIIPKGVPELYGVELGISFDDVSPTDARKADATIKELSTYEDMQLDADQTERYINVLYRLNGGISCEYCCGARSVIFESGERACGCAHSFAMRGLTKYLLTEHDEEYTDEELQAEVGKWKTLFFPTQISQKYELLKAQGIDAGYAELTNNKYRGIEKQTSGGMVGGC